VRLLVVNAGSSSVKLSVLDGDELVHEREPGRLDTAELRCQLGELGAVDAVGHRIVHGGERFHSAVVVDSEIERALSDLSTLAPLHQPRALAALATASEVFRDVPAIACFDTAFHATLPAAAHTYALPAAWREGWRVRRYGFHGLAHAWAARRTGELLDCPATALRIVTCHLGAGASLAAVDHGRSVDTTMGFTPLDGLVMATRSGSVDPGLLLWLLEQDGLGTTALATALEHDSGLLALAGTADMRTIIADAANADDRAHLALGVYLHRLRAGIAAMATAMGGLDALAFSGGVGEHAPAVRAQAAEGLAFLGVGIDPVVNDADHGDRELTAPGSAVRTVVLTAREDLEIARQMRALLREHRSTN
jgi:acetate kinase